MRTRRALVTLVVAVVVASAWARAQTLDPVDHAAGDMAWPGIVQRSDREPPTLEWSSSSPQSLDAAGRRTDDAHGTRPAHFLSPDS